MTLSRIIFVENNALTASVVTEWLNAVGHEVTVCRTSEEARLHTGNLDFDLAMIDLDLPENTGIVLVRDFRKFAELLPILSFADDKTAERREQALALGADIYMSKPFRIQELVAAVTSLLNRAPKPKPKLLIQDDLELDLTTRVAFVNKSLVPLDPKEFDLLHFFLTNPNQVFAPRAIMERVWVANTKVTTQALTTCLKRLRRKIDNGRARSRIRSIYGSGYCLDAREVVCQV